MLDRFFICRDCRLKHAERCQNAAHLKDAYSDWQHRHRGHRTAIKRMRPEWLDYQGNANIKAAFAAEATMTTTNLQSLVGSATAGWSSASVDNTSNLYIDALVQVVIAAVNTAPGNDKAHYIYCYGSGNATDFTNTGTSGGTVGTEGALTFPSISTPLPVVMPLLGILPYPVQNKACNSPMYSVARAMGGTLPPYWGVCILSFAGFTLASSGNTVKWTGVSLTSI